MTPTVEHIVAAGVRREVAQRWLDGVRAACLEFSINTPERIAAFLSQCAHESGGFTMLEENLNYRAVTMAAVWPTRFAVRVPDPKDPKKLIAQKGPDGRNIPNAFALAIERKPEMIANAVYGGRMGNGPIESGEGWKFRGRGLKQLTGKDNYLRCGRALQLDLVDTPDLLITPSPAARSAAWFWHANGCNAFADRGDIEGLTRRINGGLIGIDDRRKRYNACIATIRAATV
jgi:putative chitinase